jgi:predicted ATPase
MSAPPLIRRIVLRNYKSIGKCDVALGRLTFVVGPNGAGKSNFLDAFRFVADALRTSLDHALRERGTIGEVRRRSGGHPNSLALELTFALPDGRAGEYGFEIGAEKDGGYRIRAEHCRLASADVLGPAHEYRVESGRIATSSVPTLPAVVPDRLLLVAASGLPEFRPVFDALSRMEIYNINPRAIAAMQAPDPGGVLRRDGANAASVLRHLADAPRQRIQAHLARIVPGIADAAPRMFGTLETIEFRQDVRGQEHPWRFPAASMSDGTLRAFGILLAVLQATAPRPGVAAPLLVGIEEPELALHPAALPVLLGALREATRHCQLLVTSHSPELLDHPDIGDETLLAVDAEGGTTELGPIDSAGCTMLRERLFTAGELLRQNQLARARPGEDETAALDLLGTGAA